MKNKYNILSIMSKIIILAIVVICNVIISYAATLTDANYYTYSESDYYPVDADTLKNEIKILSINSVADLDIPVPTDVVLNSDGEVSWNIAVRHPWYTPTDKKDFAYKKFEVQLMKRQWVESSTGGYYEYKPSGSAKTVTLTTSDEDDYFASLAISTPGYYIARVRAMSIEGRYSCWGWQQDVYASVFESDTTNVNITNGTQAQYIYGPGTQNYNGQMNNGMQVQPPFYNQGYQNNPYYYGNGNYAQNSGYGNYYQQGQYVYQNGQLIPYQNYGQYYNQNNYAQNNQGMQAANIGVAPGNANGASQNIQGPGVTQSKSPYSSNWIGNVTEPGAVQYGQGTNTNNLSTEVGWHNDNNGVYYYLGNGTYLRDQWYLINDSYYRFNSSGYVMVSKWFKDPSNSGWYYLGSDGKMVTGWIKDSGIWYYLNPQKGTYYGVMYANCSLPIDGKYYAFNDQGACVINGWYGGNYYGADGSRQN